MINNNYLKYKAKIIVKTKTSKKTVFGLNKINLDDVIEVCSNYNGGYWVDQELHNRHSLSDLRKLTMYKENEEKIELEFESQKEYLIGERIINNYISKK